MNLCAKPYLVATEWPHEERKKFALLLTEKWGLNRGSDVYVSVKYDQAFNSSVRRSIANYLTLTVWRTCYSWGRTYFDCKFKTSRRRRKTLLKTPWKSSWIDNKLTFLNRCADDGSHFGTFNRIFSRAFYYCIMGKITSNHLTSWCIKWYQCLQVILNQIMTHYSGLQIWLAIMIDN